MRKFGEIPYRGENLRGSISCSVTMLDFLSGFCCARVLELYFIANFYLMLVDLVPHVTISYLVQISDTKPRRVRRRVAS